MNWAQWGFIVSFHASQRNHVTLIPVIHPMKRFWRNTRLCFPLEEQRGFETHFPGDENSLEMLLSTTRSLPPTRQAGSSSWLCPLRGSFCPPATGGADLPTPGGGLGSSWRATLRGCAGLWMPASSLGLLQLAGSREGRWAGCQAFFQHRFRKKILQSAKSPDFQQFTF